MKKVSIVIVTYNTKDILIDCLKNLRDAYSNLEIIVVDNGDDGTTSVIRDSFAWMKVISQGNVGLAAGSNLGFDASTGDYILYLGSDAFPKKGVIEALVKYMDDHTDVGIATVKLVLRDGRIDMDAHRGFPTPWAALTHFLGLNTLFPKSKIFNQYFLGYMDMNIEHEIDMCIAHFMFIRREVFDSVGRWDETFFLYGEDVDFSYRVKKKGWKIMYLPQLDSIHYKGLSVGVRKETADITKADPNTKRRVRKNSVEAMKLFYDKHYKDVYPLPIRFAVLTGVWLIGLIRGID